MEFKQAFPTPRSSNDDQSIRTDPISKIIQFAHPAYPDSEQNLLELYAFDGHRSGIDYDLAFTSCCIVTGNTFATGWLATRVATLDGEAVEYTFPRVNRPPDGILRERRYYFCIGDQDPTTHKYGVLPSFDHWRFPHGKLPSPWSDLHIDPFISDIPGPPPKGKAAAKNRDRTCRVSDYGDAVEPAHLVPHASGNWFTNNKMKQYCLRPSEPSVIDDEKNCIVLRRDIHHLFDTRRFVLVPKAPPPATTTATSSSSTLPPAATTFSAAPQLVMHVMLPASSPEFVTLYHNRLLQPVRGISVEFLFARFAWALFTDENLPFFGGLEEYRVLLFDKGKLNEQLLQGSQIKKAAKLFGTYSPARSVSPKKRQLAEMDEDAFGTDSCGGDDDCDENDDDSGVDESRGRSRKRGFEETDQDDGPNLGCSFTTASDSSGMTPLDELSPGEMSLVEVSYKTVERSRKRHQGDYNGPVMPMG